MINWNLFFHHAALLERYVKLLRRKIYWGWLMPKSYRFHINCEMILLQWEIREVEKLWYGNIPLR